jgi:hypothetical protein
VLLLIGFVLYFYNEFNGNPISKYYATKELESYLKETYPKKEFRLDPGSYNFKDKAYSFNVIEIGSATPGGSTPREYDFSVSGFLKPTVQIDGIYIENLDQDLMEKIGKEAREEIKSLLSHDVKNIMSVDVYVEFLKGQYPSDSHWNKSMKFQKPMWMHIYLDATNGTKEQVFESVKKIQASLNKHGYEYDSVNINANVIGDPKLMDKSEMKDIGYVKFATSFKKDEVLKLKNIKEFNR